LAALDSTYHDYAATEVRAAVGEAGAEAAEVRRLSATAARLADEIADLTSARAAVEAAVAEHERRITALDGRIDALKASDAYRAGTELHDRREQVRLADGAAATARRHHAAAEQRLALTRQARRRAIAEAVEDHARLVERLTELRALLAASGVAAPTPDPPAQPVDAAAGQPAVHAAAGADVRGTDAVAADQPGFERQLASVRAAAAVRREHVREAVALLGATGAAETELARAADGLARARADAADAQDRAATARRARDEAAGALHDELDAWRAALVEHLGRHALATDPAAVPAAGELLAGADEAMAEHRREIDAVLDEHAGRVAALDAAQRVRRAEVAEAEAAHAALLAVDLPEVPQVGWQVPGGSPRLAECVDVAPHLTPDEQAGLEAALEASQLLAAEVDPAGGLLVDGRLVVRAGAAVPRPLGEHVVVTLPAGADRSLAATVAAVLATISVDPADLELPGERTVVLTDGRFRCGSTAGRHAKVAAEHLGLTARRASLERRREAAEAAVHAARHALAAATAAHGSAAAARDDARALRRTLPEPAALHVAAATLARAGEQLERAVERVADQTERYGMAEDALADAAARLDRHAATAGVPRHAEGLTRLDHELRRTGAACDRSVDGFVTLARSVRNWRERANEDGEALHGLSLARQELDAAEAELLDRSTQLAVLEEHVGRAHAEVVAAVEQATADRAAAVTALASARTELGERRERAGVLQAETERAARDRDEADGRGVAQLDALRRLFEVPGFAAALAPAPSDAVDPVAEVALPAVERSAAGLRALADAVAVMLPPGDRTVSADTVRQSLRQRRDALGAGWDAEDRQPDPALPLQVEVTGPLGRMPLRAALLEVGEQLRRAERLLTSQQDQALRNLLQGLIAREVAEKLLAARDLIGRMNGRLDTIRTSHGIGVSLRWRRADDLDPATVTLLELLAKPADLRTVEEDQRLVAALAARIAGARAESPDVPYRILLGTVLDYRRWHQLTILVHRPGREPERLTRRTALSEGEKKMVSYLP
ncbi:MAG: hypothetical protein IT196_22610, partial [Acidimicrobiales bacterium]|nr:hypothetical protein [Acidimicrobiales bacterium]